MDDLKILHEDIEHVNNLVGVTADFIYNITHNMSKYDYMELPPLDSLLRAKLYEAGILAKYTNPIVIQELLINAQRSILKNPLSSYDYITNMVNGGPIIHDPVIIGLIHDRSKCLDDWIGAWNSDLRLPLVEECMDHLIQMNDSDFIMNNVFCNTSMCEIINSSAIWLAIKGGQTGDLESFTHEDRIDMTRLSIGMLIKRSDYFFYPGAKDDLVEIYDKGLTKAVEMITTNDLSSVSDFRTTMMYYLYGDVAGLFDEYGDRDNYLGIDRITVDLSERIVDKVVDAMIQCIWDNLETLVQSSFSHESNPYIRRMLENIVRTYLGCMMR